MMVFSPINDQAYDEAAIQITYCKLFPLLTEDFLTRLDSKEMMLASNLIVQTDAGQAVSTTGSPVAQSGSTTSPGQGRVNATYLGDYKKPGTLGLEQEKKAIKEAGGQVTGSVLEAGLGE
jgi:hypothetical protein